MTGTQPKPLSRTDRYLTLWIFLAMGLGIFIGYFSPNFTYFISSLQVGSTPLP
mgnify:CR=1 FL=1